MRLRGNPQPGGVDCARTLCYVNRHESLRVAQRPNAIGNADAPRRARAPAQTLPDDAPRAAFIRGRVGD